VNQPAGRLAILVPSLTNGGAQRAAANLSAALTPQFRVVTIVHDGSGGVSYPFAGELVDLKTPPSVSLPGKLLTAARRVIKVRRLKRRYGVAATISFMEGSNFVNVLSGGGGRVVLCVQNHHSARSADSGHRIVRLAYSLLSRMLYNRADLVVALSGGVARSLVDDVRVSRPRVRVVPNAIDLDAVHRLQSEPLPSAYAFLAQAVVISTAGRLTVQKGQWHLLRAFRIVKDAQPDAKLVLLGDGELSRYLADLARTLGFRVFAVWEDPALEPKDCDVLFLGFQTNPFQYFAHSAIFALPSLWEGLGNVLLEAMAAGVPVVAADCRSGPREILAPQTDISRMTNIPEAGEGGVLMPVCDGVRRPAGVQPSDEERLWAATLLDLLRQPGARTRFAVQARRRAADFGLDVVGAEWRRLLAQISPAGTGG
jgi:glycosyltransferase involved in cell wall biosynthesis